MPPRRRPVASVYAEAQADYVGLVFAHQEPNKLAKAGLHTTRSTAVDAPVIDEFPVALECRPLKVNEDGNIIGQIVNISADEKVLSADGKIDAAKLRAISFDPCGSTYVKRWARLQAKRSRMAESLNKERERLRRRAAAFFTACQHELLT